MYVPLYALLNILNIKITGTKAQLRQASLCHLLPDLGMLPAENSMNEYQRQTSFPLQFCRCHFWTQRLLFLHLPIHPLNICWVPVTCQLTTRCWKYIDRQIRNHPETKSQIGELNNDQHPRKKSQWQNNVVITLIDKWKKSCENVKNRKISIMTESLPEGM